MFFLKQNNTRKERVNNAVLWLKFDDGKNNSKYKIKTIYNNAIYTKKFYKYQLPDFYYLVL